MTCSSDSGNFALTIQIKISDIIFYISIHAIPEIKRSLLLRNHIIIYNDLYLFQKQFAYLAIKRPVLLRLGDRRRAFFCRRSISSIITWNNSERTPELILPVQAES